MKSLTFNNLITMENLYLAYRKTNRSKHRFTNSALLFNIDKDNNLLKILSDLISNKYKFGKYKRMIITDNKRREIHAPIYRDKIVHHMLNNLLLPYVSTRYSKNSFACIKNRGNIHAVKFLQNQIRIAKRLYGDQAQLIKIDVSKFFYTINRDIMKQRLSLIIKDQRLLNLAFKIIDSFDNEKIGLPLGNLTSQTFANIYLDYIDKYITRTLGIKTYMRYADDIHIIVPNLEIAKNVRNQVINLLTQKLKLIVNPNKCYITTLDRVHALGYHIYPDYLKIDSRSKKQFKKYLKEQQIKSLNGWYGQAQHAKCHSLIYKNIYNTNIDFDGKVFKFKK